MAYHVCALPDAATLGAGEDYEDRDEAKRAAFDLSARRGATVMIYQRSGNTAYIALVSDGQIQEVDNATMLHIVSPASAGVSQYEEWLTLTPKPPTA